MHRSERTKQGERRQQEKIHCKEMKFTNLVCCALCKVYTHWTEAASLVLVFYLQALVESQITTRSRLPGHPLRERFSFTLFDRLDKACMWRWLCTSSPFLFQNHSSYPHREMLYHYDKLTASGSCRHFLWSETFPPGGWREAHVTSQV